MSDDLCSLGELVMSGPSLVVAPHRGHAHELLLARAEVMNDVWYFHLSLSQVREGRDSSRA
jgi:hypothetical protein